MATPDTLTSRDRFRPDIQGLRAFAVGAVLLYHAGVPFLPGGYVGVDVFFVISGFLITGHLLDQFARHGRIRFGEFYARRARRILPASFVVLVGTVLAALVWFPPLLMQEVWRGAVATALYVPNYLFAVDGTDYLADSAPSLFQHYWSLGVEEQFYLVWPALLALGWAVLRSRRALFAILVVVVVGSFVWCLVATGQSQSWAFFSLPTRAWELGVGGLVAFAVARGWRMRSPLAAAALGWAGLAVMTASAVWFSSSTVFPGPWALMPVLGTAAVILGGATPARFGPSGVLSMRGMLFVGEISYSLYLVHWPALTLPQIATPDELPLWVTLGIAAACVPAAWLLYRFVENPLRRSRVLARPRRALIGAAAGSLACLVVATGASAYADSRELSVEETVPATQIEQAPEGTDIVPENLEPSLREADESLPEIFDDGCNQGVSDTDTEGCVYGDPEAPRIVLFGDSHAAHWFPAVEAVAEEQGYAVEVHTKSSCPAASVPVMRDGVAYETCEPWRDDVISRLNEEKPALVLLVSYGATPVQPGVDDDVQTWAEGLGETLDALEAPTAVIADTPDQFEDPSTCLSVHLADAEVCGTPRSEALSGPSRDAEVVATAERGVPLIDVNDYLCDAGWCPPIIGNTLVYRDSHHLTAVFAAEMAEVLGERLAPVLADAGSGR
ncbi:acyltransferase family protein [Microbacterium thalassium]|uniref:Peptidoglycan/LPS O-acetylase OafA/YrhL n=1 Tax=Microbacterium thalassium TaxID=362649 RepID=A0A7X0FS95_9MICO|nr:acyltransferase family protein [Microbacterium thalassium]MBB6392754.1 peptidoglycan/LPS O-acetylase OafA/YrhL [Microbacterium thalassium]GLK23014.1 acyltransferase [Microbacterium thalassium]